MVTPTRLVVSQVEEPVAEVYCTDQPVTSTEVPPRLNNSMKSFLNVAPLFPPPPYTWLITMPVETRGACGLVSAQTVLAMSTMSACAMASPNPRGTIWFLDIKRLRQGVGIDIKKSQACRDFVSFDRKIF